jgi:predicted  nucleic acid-binding Zn-ribbon protein
MTYEQPTTGSSRSPFLRAIEGFFRVLLRLLFILIVGVLIGGGLYFGAPWVYTTLVEPVQQNTVRVAALEQRMAQEQARLQDENRALQERIAALETKVDVQRDDFGVQVQDVEDIAGQVQQLDLRIAQVEEGLESQQDAGQATRSQLDSAINDLSERTEEVTGRAEELEGRLALLQTAQDLVKVRLLLLEENSRNARDTLTLAMGHLDQAMVLMPEQTETLSELRSRMAGLERLIEERSFRVTPELESLWADVMDLVLPVTLPAAGEGTPETSPVPTPTLTPSP